MATEDQSGLAHQEACIVVEQIRVVKGLKGILAHRARRVRMV